MLVAITLGYRWWDSQRRGVGLQFDYGSEAWFLYPG